MTTNSGRTFKPATSSKFFTLARYAAFPSDTTWYITAGEWPENNTDAAAATRRPRSAFLNADGTYPRNMDRKRAPPAPGNDNGYKAQIVKVRTGSRRGQACGADGRFTFFFSLNRCT